MAELGLSDPLWLQYWSWVKDIARGDFGRSFFRSESVAEMILRRGPLTAQIAFLSVVLSWLVGIPVAILSALRPNSLADNVVRFVSIFFLAVPGFWLGMLIVLALLFTFGYRAPLTGASLFTDPWTTLQMVVGPALVLGLGQAAYIARMARSSLLEVVREDYVRTARAKGLSNRLVIALHALPNALLPVITLSGILLGLRPGRVDPGRARVRHAGARLCHVHRRQRARRVRHAEPGVPVRRRVRAAQHPGRHHHRLAGPEDTSEMTVTAPDATVSPTPLPRPAVAGRQAVELEACGAIVRHVRPALADVGVLGAASPWPSS